MNSNEMTQLLFAILFGVAVLYVVYIGFYSFKKSEATQWFIDNDPRLSATFRKYGFWLEIQRTYAGDSLVVAVNSDHKVWNEMEYHYKREPRARVYLQGHHLLQLKEVIEKAIRTQDPKHFEMLVISLFPKSRETSPSFL